jgi:8-oxo-dGTP pyrophosphatase MutT (NUDIX family)
MYKVFCDSVKILILSKIDFINYEMDLSTEISLSDLIFRIKNSKLDSNYHVIGSNPKALIDEFESHFKVKIAGGGWVFNSINELLMILRNGKWDIPKGHLEKNESIEECAVREVKEETGILNLYSLKYVGQTRHVFMEKNEWILKLTYWYSMKTDEIKGLVPQTEEGIETVEWVEPLSIEKRLKKGWHSLLDFYQDNFIG